MAAFADPLLGKVIGGYKLDELIGRGNITAVYRARAEGLQRDSALLATIFLVPETLPQAAKTRFHARFLQEAQHIFTLRHPHILPLRGYGEQEGHCYFLSPEIYGETLATYLKRHKRLRPVQAFSLLAPIAIALDYLHSQGWAYTFFNPSNVLLLKEPTHTERTPIQLTGLGLPQILRMKGVMEEESAYTSSYTHLQNIARTYFGAPEYLAPEIVKGAEGDARSDIYALGILLFTLLNGAPPYQGEEYTTIARKHVSEPLPSLHECSPEVPSALELVVNHALHRNPNSRFQTVSDFVSAFSLALEARINASSYFAVLQTVEQIKALASPFALPRLQTTAHENEPEGAFSLLLKGSSSPLTIVDARTIQAERNGYSNTNSYPPADALESHEANSQETELTSALAEPVPDHPRIEISSDDVSHQSDRAASRKLVRLPSAPQFLEGDEPDYRVQKDQQERVTRPLGVSQPSLVGELHDDQLRYLFPGDEHAALEPANSNEANPTTIQKRREMVEMAHHLQSLREHLQTRTSDQQENPFLVDEIE